MTDPAEQPISPARQDSGNSAARRPRSRRRGLWVEYGFIPAILGGVVFTALFFRANGYLPQPFFYEPNGTFTDWYWLAYWSHHPSGAYDVERAIYPPLSFLVLRLIGDSSCYALEGLEARWCDPWGIRAVLSFYVLDVILIAWIFFRLDRRTAPPRIVALCFGLPLIYSVERGQLVTLCLACMLLAYGPLVRSARLRWLFAGIAVNFKVYLIAAILAPLLRRRWLAVEGALFAVVFVYLLSWLFFGSGDPIQLYKNVNIFASMLADADPTDLWYPSSYIPAISLLKGLKYPISTLIGSHTADVLLSSLTIYARFGQIMIVGAVAASWFRPEVVPPHRLVFFGIALALISSEVGGYTQVILLAFVFMERWRGFARPGALVVAYILCIPMEYVISPLPSGIVRESYLSGRHVIVYYGVGIMSLIRPALIQLISTFLAAATIHDVWVDMRQRGHLTRWRFRRDWPIVPWVARPQRPAIERAPQSSDEA